MAKKFIVACGGTGGHSFPGLAVAQELRARGHEVVVWASGRAIESSVMKSWDGAVFSTGARPLTAKNAFANFFSLLRCWREMKRSAPDALLAMGSYASLAPVVAASMRHVPVVLHEANTVPGRAVDWLARKARAVAVSFAATEATLVQKLHALGSANSPGAALIGSVEYATHSFVATLDADHSKVTFSFGLAQSRSVISTVPTILTLDTAVCTSLKVSGE
jgi:UDP-N-acetylglucosamine:LPS N-acetylglucosamine transferase